jgi:hypothetical protein
MGLRAWNPSTGFRLCKALRRLDLPLSFRPSSDVIRDTWISPLSLIERKFLALKDVSCTAFPFLFDLNIPKNTDWLNHLHALTRAIT